MNIRPYIHSDWFRMYNWCYRQLQDENYEVDWVSVVRPILLLPSVIVMLYIAYRVNGQLLLGVFGVFCLFMVVIANWDYYDSQDD